MARVDIRPVDGRPDRGLERAVRRCAAFLDLHGVVTTRGWLVAVSGGADSLALWRVAAALGLARGFVVEAVHVDHGLRPSAQAEARQVRALAPRLRTPCHVVSVRVVQAGQGPEAAAREARHAALEQVRAQRGLDVVALGHTLDDQAETVLMRALTGAGLRGLAAMAPLAGARLRPLLWMRRCEAAALAGALGCPVVDDASNRDRRLLRPRLRHDVMPLLATALGDLAPHLAALADEAAGAHALIRRELAAAVATHLQEQAVFAARREVAALPAWLRGQWLLLALAELGAVPRRARVSAARFARLVDGERPFALHLSGARVRATALELRVERLASIPEQGR